MQDQQGLCDMIEPLSRFLNSVSQKITREKNARKKSRSQQKFHGVKNEPDALWYYVEAIFHQYIVYLSVHLLLECICKTTKKSYGRSKLSMKKLFSP